MKKPRLPRRAKKEATPSRITNETVAEHRERILAGGRRFKYPMQYARHKLVINAIILGLVALIAVVLIVAQQLYYGQNTSDFFYRITRAVPVPVASVDGHPVRYSNYLLYFNGSAYYLERSEQVNFSSTSGRDQLTHIKRESLNDAESDTYASALATKYQLSVSDKEVSQVIDKTRKSYDNASQEAYNASALSVLGWTPSEYNMVIKQKLLRLKVAYKMDTNASKLEQRASAVLAGDPATDFGTLAKQLDPSGRQVSIGASGLVPIGNSDGGLSLAAAKLQVGEVSKPVKTSTGDGYYFIKLLSKNSSQISYAYVKIGLTEFDAQFTKLRDQGKIAEYIKVPLEKQ